MLRVHSIESFGTSDGPGIRMIVFTQGCWFRCLYCHNPDTQCLDGGTLMKASDIIARAKNMRAYFSETGGITVSGGEPTIQAKEVHTLFRAAQKAGIHTALDTNGGVATDAVRKLYADTDLVILDVKHIRDDAHQKLTGKPNDTVLEMAAFRESQKKPMWLRYVLVPGINDSDEDLHAWGKHFASYKSIERVELLPYHTFGVHKYLELGREYSLVGVRPPTPELIEHARSILAQYRNDVVVH